VLWRAEQRGDGKPTKVPYCVSDPRRKASSTDPATWATFDDAVEAYGVVPADGIGCVPAEISCVDLDRVIAADGALDVRAETIVDRCAAVFTHITPGSRGALLTTAEMAERLGISPKSLLRQKSRGQIKPAHQRGKFVRWSGAER
jgi:hypothetical protein